MGFLDRVKASFAAAMGGRAVLRLELGAPAAAPGGTITYRLVLETTGPLKADKITVELLSRERVRVWVGGAPPPATSPHADGAAVPLDRVEVSAAGARETVTFRQEATVVATELVLASGQTREFAGELPVPETAQPTYRGIDALHSWWVRTTVRIPLGDDLVEETEVHIR